MDSIDTNDLIEIKFLELKKYIDDCFEEQSKENKKFFNNILELIKLNVNDELENNRNKMLDIIERFEKTSKLNDVVSNKIIDTLKEIDYIQYGDKEDDDTKKIKIIYDDVKKGVKQFSIQLVIVVIIFLTILGGYQLINWTI